MNTNSPSSVASHSHKPTAVEAEVEVFVNLLLHDFQAPLRALDSFVQLLGQNYSAQMDDRGRNYLQRVRRASEYMRTHVNDLERLFRPLSEGLSREEFDLSQMARLLFDELQKQEPQRLVKLHIGQALRCNADPHLVRLALENLLSNAWKFTRNEPHPKIEFGAVPNARQTYFVRDNGAGFDAADSSELFAPFHRLHRREEFPGKGLGLTLVQRIVRKHGGEITATGKSGFGATFTFSL
jgi:light-regulated signal transduction histidine kinase (bacteriophytochrome)